MTDELRFEMDRLVAYDDASLLDELRRVASLIPTGPITAAAYSTLARADADTLRRRFGGWQQALDRAGLGDRYVGTKVTQRMHAQGGRTASADEVIAELQRVARVVGRAAVTQADLEQYGELFSVRTVRARFGTWSDALTAAGLTVSNLGRRYTEDDYFENLLAVWTSHGRAPTYAEMDRTPSVITSAGYAKRFGSWTKAKQAFVDRVRSDVDVTGTPVLSPTPRRPKGPAVRPEDQRWIPVGVRYQVLRRDRFRCVTCGRSPATNVGCVLHVDHIVAFARGGKTQLGNLRTLCADCNLGKGAGDQ